MAFDEELAGRIRQLLARRKHVEEKMMFSGIGFLLNGNLLVGVQGDDRLDGWIQRAAKFVGNLPAK